MTAVPLAKYRPELDVIEELRWYFQRSMAAMGLGSSWTPLADRAQSGGSFGAFRADAFSADDARVDAGHRQQGIGRVLAQLPPETVSVLESAFDERQHATPARVAFGQVVNLVRRDEQARTYYAGYVDKCVARAVKPDTLESFCASNRVFAAECVDRLEALYFDALWAYAQKKKALARLDQALVKGSLTLAKELRISASDARFAILRHGSMEAARVAFAAEAQASGRR
jgi:hypothetical protein